MQVFPDRDVLRRTEDVTFWSGDTSLMLIVGTSTGPSAGCGTTGPVTGCGTTGPVTGCGTTGPVTGCGTTGPVTGCGTTGPSAGCGTSGALIWCASSGISVGAAAAKSSCWNMLRFTGQIPAFSKPLVAVHSVAADRYAPLKSSAIW